jgi:hypothetical protein
MVPDLKLFWLLFSKNRPPKPTNIHRNVDIELNYRDNRRIKDGKTKPWYAFISPWKLITYFYALLPL